jgi:hypothetical protein
MTLLEFRDLLLSADPQASHYTSTLTPNYTVWHEYGEKPLMADNAAIETVHKIQIDRFTKIEFDPLADAITQLLKTNEIAHEHLTDFEQDTGYIHHIWDCEVD